MNFAITITIFAAFDDAMPLHALLCRHAGLLLLSYAHDAAVTLLATFDAADAACAMLRHCCRCHVAYAATPHAMMLPLPPCRAIAILIRR